MDGCLSLLQKQQQHFTAKSARPTSRLRASRHETASRVARPMPSRSRRAVQRHAETHAENQPASLPDQKRLADGGLVPLVVEMDAEGKATNANGRSVGNDSGSDSASVRPSQEVIAAASPPARLVPFRNRVACRSGKCKGRGLSEQCWLSGPASLQARRGHLISPVTSVSPSFLSASTACPRRLQQFLLVLLHLLDAIRDAILGAFLDTAAVRREASSDTTTSGLNRIPSVPAIWRLPSWPSRICRIRR